MMGLRKPRGPDGSRSSGEDPDREEEEDEGGSMRERMMSYAMPASERRPPEEDDIWSKHSVFEFKRYGRQLFFLLGCCRAMLLVVWSNSGAFAVEG